MNEISGLLREKLLAGFEEYGLTLPQFYVTHVVLPEDDPNFKRIRELHTIMLQTRVIQAEATVKTVQAQSEATYRTAQEQSKAAITAAQRQVELEKQTTETEVARREAERTIIRAQAEAQAQRLAGLTEAEIMHAKGYDQKDVIEADVKKAYAAGLGQMGGSGGGLGDIANLGVTLGAMGGVIGMTKEAVSPMFEQPTAPVTDGWNCACGTKNITSSFCPDCGAKRPISVSGWDCTCGTKNINSNFCPNCGAKRPFPSIGWNCTCGAQNITSSFCPDCGKKKEDN